MDTSRHTADAGVGDDVIDEEFELPPAYIDPSQQVIGKQIQIFKS